jgi:hypothetical protein
MKKSVNREYVRRFYPGDLAPLASAREHVIAFVYGCTAARPFLKVVGALFNGGQEEEVSKEEFLTWVNDEIAALEKCLSAQVLELTKQPASWHSRDDLFPHGMKLQELYNDYLQVREEMASCYARVISVTRMAPSSPVVFGAPVPPPGTEQVRSRRRRRHVTARPLTATQTEALAALTDCGGKFAEAGRQLGLDRKTVEEYGQAACKKLGVSLTARLKQLRAAAKAHNLPHGKSGEVYLTEEQDLLSDRFHSVARKKTVTRDDDIDSENGG